MGARRNHGECRATQKVAAAEMAPTRRHTTMKDTNGDKPAMNGALRLATSKVLGFLINVIMLIAFAFFGFWSSNITNRQNTMEAALAVANATLASRGERISSVETKAASIDNRLTRIEDKIDRLSDRLK